MRESRELRVLQFAEVVLNFIFYGCWIYMAGQARSNNQPITPGEIRSAIVLAVIMCLLVLQALQGIKKSLDKK